MKKLHEGIKQFQEEHFPALQEKFAQLANGQKPDTLFITCVDSRILPQLITSTGPGELFVLRNVGNVVPSVEEAEQFSATPATLEYAVKVLEVSNIVVCGHSNCGGCQAIFKEQSALDKLPFIKKWLSVLNPLKKAAQTDSFDHDSEQVEKNNVIRQLNNLSSYPFVKERVEQKKLTLAGWYYQIHTGSIFEYDPNTEEFKQI